MKKLLWASVLCLGLAGCMEYYDESTLITDDAGYVHRTMHYLT